MTFSLTKNAQNYERIIYSTTCCINYEQIFYISSVCFAMEVLKIIRLHMYRHEKCLFEIMMKLHTHVGAPIYKGLVYKRMSVCIIDIIHVLP